MLKEDGAGRYSYQTLRKNLEKVLFEMGSDSDLFASLLETFPSRVAAVLQAEGGQTDY